MTNMGIYALLVSLLLMTRAEGVSASDESGMKLKTTKRALLDSVCQTTLYKDACMRTLGSSNASITDPGQFVRVSFQVAKDALMDGVSKSTTINQAKLDPRAAQGLQVCNETIMYALHDMEMSVNAVGKLDNAGAINGFLEDLKVWMGGCLTYQDVCYDAFTGAKDTEPGRKIRTFFKTSRELTSNALALMDKAQGVASLVDVSNLPPIQGLFGGNRRLLKKSESDSEDSEKGEKAGSKLMPPWMKDAQRKLLATPLAQIKPDAVVAQDGSGQFKTIQEALNKHPNVSSKNPDVAAKPYIVHIKKGVYKEVITVAKKQHNVFLVGDGATQTIVTNNKNFVDGFPTFKTATAGFMGDGVMVRDIGFENSAGAHKHQAVAVKVAGDFAIFYNCIFDGFQDTLYPIRGRHFYRDCTIKGTIDFIFGDAQAVFQSCQMVIKKPMDSQACAVTAQGRSDPNGPGGTIMQNCSIVADGAFTPDNKAFLGRPWKPYSRTVIMQSFIDKCIAPEGWEEWLGNRGTNTLFYAEFGNRGPGSNLDGRVKWQGIKKLSAQQVAAFTPDAFFKGSEWVSPSGVPYFPGMSAAN